MGFLLLAGLVLWSRPLPGVGLVVGAAASATVFVTPGAMTLHEAQAAARLLLAADGPEGLVRVRLAAGVHSLARPLRLGPEDSSVLWQAEPGAR